MSLLILLFLLNVIVITLSLLFLLSLFQFHYLAAIDSAAYLPTIGWHKLGFWENVHIGIYV